MGRVDGFVRFSLLNANGLLALTGLGIVIVASMVLASDFIYLAEGYMTPRLLFLLCSGLIFMGIAIVGCIRTTLPAKANVTWSGRSILTLYQLLLLAVAVGHTILLLGLYLIEVDLTDAADDLPGDNGEFEGYLRDAFNTAFFDQQCSGDGWIWSLVERHCSGKLSEDSCQCLDPDGAIGFSPSSTGVCASATTYSHEACCPDEDFCNDNEDQACPYSVCRADMLHALLDYIRPAMSFSIFMLTLEALILILTCLLICHNPRDRTKDLLVKTFVRRAGERWEVSGPSTGISGVAEAETEIYQTEDGPSEPLRQFMSPKQQAHGGAFKMSPESPSDKPYDFKNFLRVPSKDNGGDYKKNAADNADAQCTPGRAPKVQTASGGPRVFKFGSGAIFRSTENVRPPQTAAANTAETSTSARTTHAMETQNNANISTKGGRASQRRLRGRQYERENGEVKEQLPQSEDLDISTVELALPSFINMKNSGVAASISTSLPATSTTTTPTGATGGAAQCTTAAAAAAVAARRIISALSIPNGEYDDSSLGEDGGMCDEVNRSEQQRRPRHTEIASVAYCQFSTQTPLAAEYDGLGREASARAARQQCFDWNGLSKDTADNNSDCGAESSFRAPSDCGSTRQEHTTPGNFTVAQQQQDAQYDGNPSLEPTLVRSHSRSSTSRAPLSRPATATATAATKGAAQHDNSGDTPSRRRLDRAPESLIDDPTSSTPPPDAIAATHLQQPTELMGQTPPGSPAAYRSKRQPWTSPKTAATLSSSPASADMAKKQDKPVSHPAPRGI